MGESQYSRHFRSKIPKIRISKIHQKWSKLCSGEWNGTRKWCFGSCCTFVFDAFNQHLNSVKKMQVLVRKSVSKCHRSSLFPTFSFSLINKTHGRCQESRLFHSQRFCFQFLFTPKRWKRAFRTSRQNKTEFHPKTVLFKLKLSSETSWTQTGLCWKEFSRLDFTFERGVLETHAWL